jgi:serine protease Do
MKNSHRLPVFVTAWTLVSSLLSQPLLVGSAHAAVAPPKINLQESAISPQTKAATSLAPVVKRASISVVNIYSTRKVREASPMMPFFNDPFFRQFFGDPHGVPRERKEQSLGSGVIVSEDGYLLTNSHVVEGADEIKVAMADERTVFTAKLVGTDPRTDIAVLKVDGKKLPAIAITDSDKLEVGDMVLAIGNPFGVGQTVTAGMVSAKSRGGMGIVDYEDFIQTDASINPGNSGGALVDAEGRLVGINTAILSRTGGNQGVGFAVPVNLARYVMERLVVDGKVTRSFLGVGLQSVNAELAKEFKLRDQTGALVGEIVPGSPAEEAGLKEGDVIVEFNGKKVTDSRQLRLMLAQTPPDAQTPLKVVRDGKEQAFSVTLTEMSENGGMARAESRSGGLRRSPKVDVLDGVTVGDLDNRTRRQFNLPMQLRGAIVVEVEPSCPAAEAGLRPGDVIVEINRKSVGSADEAVELGNRIKGDRALLRVWSNGGSRYILIEAPKGE